MSDLNIGVLSIQGDVAENGTSIKDALKEMGKTGTIIKLNILEAIKPPIIVTAIG